MIWARQRVEVLIRNLEDAELLHILYGELEPESISSGGEEPRCCWAVEDGAVVRYISSWSALIDVLEDELSIGPQFIPAGPAPEPGSPVFVYLVLPEGMGTLKVAAVVETGSDAGFVLHYEPRTSEVALLLERLVSYAEDPLAEDAWLRSVGQELQARLHGADASVLGLSAGASAEDIEAAFTELRDAWVSFLDDGPLPESLRCVLDDYAGQLAHVCALLVIPEESARQSTGPIAGVRFSRRRITRPAPSKQTKEAVRIEPTPPRPSAPYSVGRTPVVTPPTPGRALVRNARRFTNRLAPRPRRRIEPIVSKPVEPTTPPAEPEGIALASACLASRDYDGAEKALSEVLREKPQHERAQQLLQFVRARRAATTRDFETAKRLYEALLQRDPNNAAAKKELIMVSALS